MSPFNFKHSSKILFATFSLTVSSTLAGDLKERAGLSKISRRVGGKELVVSSQRCNLIRYLGTFREKLSEFFMSLAKKSFY